MSGKGNYTEAYTDVSLSRIPKEYLPKGAPKAVYNLMVMNDNNVGPTVNITAKDAKRIKSKIEAFDKDIREEFKKMLQKENIPLRMPK